MTRLFRAIVRAIRSLLDGRRDVSRDWLRAERIDSYRNTYHGPSIRWPIVKDE